jgi:hypothetical protein
VPTTQVFLRKINKLSNRIRELEDALAAAHAVFSADPHPLLSERLSMIKNPLELETYQDVNSTHAPEEEEGPIEAFQSLYVLFIFFVISCQLTYMIQIHK